MPCLTIRYALANGNILDEVQKNGSFLQHFFIEFSQFLNAPPS